MQTFKLFLESANSIEIKSSSEFIERVKNECSEYLKNSSAEDAMFRGIADFSKQFYVCKPELNRKPTDTNKFAHSELDKLFFEKFGKKYRSTAVFATTSLVRARVYGHVYYVFPTDGYTLCGSKEVSDLYSFVQYLTSSEIAQDKFRLNFFSSGAAIKFLSHDDTSRYIELAALKNVSNEEKAEINTLNGKIFQNMEYFESKKLKDFGKSEIMISTSKYYLLEYSKTGWNSSDDILKEIYE